MTLTCVEPEAASPRGPLATTESILRREALLDLLALLEAERYAFVTATPATHARVLARDGRRQGKDLRDLLGWSLPVAADAVPPNILAALSQAGVLERREDGLVAATVRASTVEGTFFLHSAYPTLDADSVFLGPDSYRFADLIATRAGGMPPRPRILDYGAGAGVGGISAARGHRDAHLTLADMNPRALFLASINATHARIDHRAVEASDPAAVDGEFDLIVTHPPFMMDEGRRAYRDGGDLYGGQLSLDWTLALIRKLTPGGRFVLHTGVSIVEGRDVLHDALRAQMPAIGFAWEYTLLDPDIFGDELDQPAYAEVERIAAIGLTVTRLAD
jgi:methylase of polypeptide subunit release factors